RLLSTSLILPLLALFSDGAGTDLAGKNVPIVRGLRAGDIDIMAGFCRDCLAEVPDQAARCSGCGSPRLARHPDLDRLAIAHVDCDAFYAAIEKRDDPSLRDKPLIVGGGRGGGGSTPRYSARHPGGPLGVPLFQAR